MPGHCSKIIFAIVIFLTGCATKNSTYNFTHFPTLNNAQVSDDYRSLVALSNQFNDENLLQSFEIFSSIYRKNHDLSYLKEAVRMGFVIKDDEGVDELLDDGMRRFKDDVDICKLQINRLIRDKKYKRAKEMTMDLIKKDPSGQNYAILGSIYYFSKDYKNALVYYEKSYKISPNEDILLKISILLHDKLHKSDLAIKELKNYIRFKNASKNVYFKLLQIYSKKMDINGVIDTYKLLYANFKDDEYAKKIVELYMFEKDTPNAIKFLEQSGYDPDLLLNLYISGAEYKKAYLAAQKIYKDTNNINYLGKMAIYEYEGNQDNMNQKILNSVVSKLQKVTNLTKLPLYYNYYGYLLIDHNIDVKKGIKYVNLALKKEPNSIFYIDSLAWGYYKLGRCDLALEQMEKIINLTNEYEIKEHYKMIKKCVKRKNDIR